MAVKAVVGYAIYMHNLPVPNALITNNVITALYTDYEPTGKIGQIDYHNGTATKYTYDAWSTKLFGIVTEDPTRDPNKLLQDREYTYSRAGDILRIEDHVQKVTYDYAYDMLHRLVSEQLSGVNAPIATRVETITLDYTGTGPVHGVKTIDLNGVSRTCAYDANGNMVTSPDFTNGTNPLNRAITYDGDNMPTRIVHANGATVDFVYDGTGKRTKKIVASGKTVLYLGDHFEVENGVNIKYIFGGNLRLAQIKGSLTYYYHKDHLGSTAAVTGEDGLKKESTTYEPFGSTRTQEGTDVSAYKFTDQELDNETGFYNYKNRLYDPVLGIFIAPDRYMSPDLSAAIRLNIEFSAQKQIKFIIIPQNLNRYSYCINNPIIYTDPEGLAWNWGAVGVGTGIGALGGFAYGVGAQAVSAAQGNGFSWGAVGRATFGGAVVGAVTGAVVGALTGDPSAALIGGSIVVSTGAKIGVTAATAAIAGLLGGATEQALNIDAWGHVVDPKDISGNSSNHSSSGNGGERNSGSERGRGSEGSQGLDRASGV